MYVNSGPEEKLDTHINACAYNYGIDRYAVLDVLAIELRDVLLAQSGSQTGTH